MANYSLVYNSKFQPFSFERYMQPISMYAQQYENRYKEMQEQALALGLMKGLVDPEIDKDVYEDLQRYDEKLSRMSDLMATVGLPPNNKRDFLDMWRQYASDVVPVETWAKMRNEDIKKQNELYLQSNGNIRFSKKAANTSLSEYKKGRPLDYEVMNLNAAMAEATGLIQAISKRNIQTGQRSLGDYIESFKQTGYADLNELMAKSPDAKAAIETVLSKYGYNSSNFTESDKRDLLNAVQEGVNGGLYYDMDSTFNPNWRAQYQLKSELDWQEFQREGEWKSTYDPDWKLKQLQLDMATNGGNSLDPGANFDIRTPIDADEIGMGVSSKYSKEISGAKDALDMLGIKEDKTDKGGIIFSTIRIPMPRGNRDNYWVAKSTLDAVTFNSRFGKHYDNKSMVDDIRRTDNYYLTTGSGNNGFRIFDKNGTLLTKDQFSNQNKEYKAYLEAYYDKYITPAINTLGNTNKTVTGFHTSGTKAISKGYNTLVYGIPINFQDNAKMLKEGAVGRLISNAGGAREVKGSIEDWSNGKKVSANDIYGELNKIDDQPTLSYHVINTVGNNGKQISGILLTSGNKRFFIPSDNMSESGKLGFSKLNETQQAKKRRDADIEAYKKEYGDAWSYYYMSDPVAQRNEAAIKASGTAALQDIVRSFTGNTYNVPTFDVINQSLTDN